MKIEKKTENKNSDTDCVENIKRKLTWFARLAFCAMWLLIMVSSFKMEIDTRVENYTVISTESRDDGTHISLSDNKEYIDVNNALNDLKTGEEISFTTVKYLRGSEKVLINNEKVYCSEYRKTDETDEQFRTALITVWNVSFVIMSLTAVIAMMYFVIDVTGLSYILP